MRGFDAGDSFLGDDTPDYVSYDDDDSDMELPPVLGDERRMQVRAYNFWTSMLGEHNFPPIEELEPEAIEDFRDYSVLLDFTSGIDDPGIAYLGEALRIEGEIEADINYLHEVPARSLLSRITDHYLQIIANRAPIGFEAEFVNQRGETIMYRGILLPFSSDDDTIDFIYGVINWKQSASPQLVDELMLEMSQALGETTLPPRATLDAIPLVTEAAPDPWSVTSEPVEDDIASVPTSAHDEAETAENQENRADWTTAGQAEQSAGNELDLSAFRPVDMPNLSASNVEVEPHGFAPLVEDDSEFADFEPDENDGLADWLYAARELAASARCADARSRTALYRAIGRAYDFSIIAQRQPDDYTALLEDAGLTVQERAPMTPIVKLVFGAGYDKTRITEFATVLSYAHRYGLEIGTLSGMLESHEGGLKAIIAEERALRREAQAKPVAATRRDPRERLRRAPTRALEDLAPEGEEFVLLVARRDADGSVALIGAVDADAAFTEKALRNTLA